MTPLLQVKNLTLHTRSDNRLLVDDVSFEIQEGESIGLVGESGSGKTLTALSVLGLLPRAVEIRSGEILFKGDSISKMSNTSLQQLRGNRISMIYQDPMTSLNPMMKIGKQIQEVLTAHGKENSKERVIQALGDVEIPDPEACFSSYPHEFSGGMRQRVMIAMAMILRPNLLVADEPTTALDVTIQRQILNLVNRERRETSMSLLWISHDLSVVSEMVDKVIVMYAGRVAEIGKVKDIFQNPQHPYTHGLIGSIVKRSHQEQLLSIPGLPPKPWEIQSSCAFADRCHHREIDCTVMKPTLQISGSHEYACFHPEEGAAW